MGQAYMKASNIRLRGKQHRTVFVVLNSNWKCEISLGQDASQFRDERQLWEASIRAVEVFKGIRTTPKLTVLPDCRGQKPTLATTMLVYEKSLKANSTAIVWTHYCLELIGLHKESAKLKAAFEAWLRIGKSKSVC
jgi:hypothetical protein